MLKEIDAPKNAFTELRWIMEDKYKLDDIVITHSRFRPDDCVVFESKEHECVYIIECIRRSEM